MTLDKVELAKEPITSVIASTDHILVTINERVYRLPYSMLSQSVIDIVNNAASRVITGSDTPNQLNAEESFLFSNSVLTLISKLLTSNTGLIFYSSDGTNDFPNGNTVGSITMMKLKSGSYIPSFEIRTTSGDEDEVHFSVGNGFAGLPLITFNGSGDLAFPAIPTRVPVKDDRILMMNTSKQVFSSEVPDVHLLYALVQYSHIILPVEWVPNGSWSEVAHLAVSIVEDGIYEVVIAGSFIYAATSGLFELKLSLDNEVSSTTYSFISRSTTNHTPYFVSKMLNLSDGDHIQCVLTAAKYDNAVGLNIDDGHMSVRRIS